LAETKPKPELDPQQASCAFDVKEADCVRTALLRAKLLRLILGS